MTNKFTDIMAFYEGLNYTDFLEHLDDVSNSVALHVDRVLPELLSGFMNDVSFADVKKLAAQSPLYEFVTGLTLCDLIVRDQTLQENDDSDQLWRWAADAMVEGFKGIYSRKNEAINMAAMDYAQKVLMNQRDPTEEAFTAWENLEDKNLFSEKTTELHELFEQNAFREEDSAVNDRDFYNENYDSDVTQPELLSELQAIEEKNFDKKKSGWDTAEGTVQNILSNYTDNPTPVPDPVYKPKPK